MAEADNGVKETAAAPLNVSGVWQRYPSKGGHQVVLSDINLDVPEPQFLTVVGPSGCGKSTLLRLILGSESPGKARSPLPVSPWCIQTATAASCFNGIRCFRISPCSKTSCLAWSSTVLGCCRSG